MFSVGISTIVGVLCGLVPAWRVAGHSLNHALKNGGRAAGPGRGARRLGDALVTTEIALALTLSVGAGLLLRSFTALQAVDSGFDTDRVLSLELTVPAHRYGAYEVGGPNAQRARLFRDLARQIAEVPGVESAAVTTSLPLRHGVNPWGIVIEGRAAPPASEPGGAAGRGGVVYHGSVSIERVTAEYFRTLGVRVLRGRPIDDRDEAGAPLVTLVNQTFARKFFPDDDPIGHQISVDMTSYMPRMTIVGVVADNKMHGLDRAPYPLLFWSVSQLPSMNGWLLARTREHPEALADQVRAAVTRIDPEIAIGDTAGLERVLRDSAWRPRFAALLLALFAALGLFQAIAGIYAVMSYSVARRTQEMGLRVTLGAKPREILALVMTHAVRLTAIGLIMGIATALAIRQLVASQLFGVSASDPATLATVSGIVAVVALAAAAVPAFRALRVDPVLALRQQ
jgi:putative ABC transport system permease protein